MPKYLVELPDGRKYVVENERELTPDEAERDALKAIGEWNPSFWKRAGASAEDAYHSNTMGARSENPNIQADKYRNAILDATERGDEAVRVQDKTIPMQQAKNYLVGLEGEAKYMRDEFNKEKQALNKRKAENYTGALSSFAADLVGGAAGGLVSDPWNLVGPAGGGGATVGRAFLRGAAASIPGNVAADSLEQSREARLAGKEGGWSDLDLKRSAISVGAGAIAGGTLNLPFYKRNFEAHIANRAKFYDDSKILQGRGDPTQSLDEVNGIIAAKRGIPPQESTPPQATSEGGGFPPINRLDDLGDPMDIRGKPLPEIFPEVMQGSQAGLNRKFDNLKNIPEAQRDAFGDQVPSPTPRDMDPLALARDQAEPFNAPELRLGEGPLDTTPRRAVSPEEVRFNQDMTVKSAADADAELGGARAMQEDIARGDNGLVPSPLTREELPPIDVPQRTLPPPENPHAAAIRAQQGSPDPEVRTHTEAIAEQQRTNEPTSAEVYAQIIQDMDKRNKKGVGDFDEIKQRLRRVPKSQRGFIGGGESKSKPPAFIDDIKDAVTALFRTIDNKRKDIGGLSEWFLTSETRSQLAENELVRWSAEEIKSISNEYDGLRAMTKHPLGAGFGFTAFGRQARHDATAGIAGTIQKIAREVGTTEFNKLIGTFREFNGSDELRKMGLQWPTVQMLKDKGLGESAIKFYQNYTKLMDTMFNVLNFGREQGGLPPIKPVPGYFPNVFPGEFRGFVTFTNDKGNPIRVAYTFGTNKKELLNNVATLTERIQKENPAWTPVPFTENDIVRTGKNDSPLTDIILALETTQAIYSNKEGNLASVISDVIGKQIAARQQAFLQHQLHRADLPGHLLDMRDISAKEFGEVIEKYIDAVFNFTKAQEIKARIIDPLLPHLGKIEEAGLSRSYQFVKSMADLYRGIDDPVLPILDQRWARPFLRRTRNLIGMLDLGWNMKYFITNAVQPAFALTNGLAVENARYGGKANTALAMANGMNALLDLHNTKAKADLDWAIKHAVTTPQLWEALDAGAGGEVRNAFSFAMGRKPAEKLEAVGRAQTFLGAVDFYRQVGLDDAAARRKAQMFVDTWMVGYGTPSQPGLISRTGVIGDTIGQYTTFRSAYYGQALMILKALKDNPTKARSYLPVINLTLSTAMLAGMRGTFLMAEAQIAYEAFKWVYENVTGEKLNIRSPMEYVLSKTKDMSHWMGDSVAFGLLSGVISKALPGVGESGVDIGSTASMPTVGDLASQPRMFGFAQSLKDAAVWLTRTATGNVSQADEMKALLSFMPAAARGYFEHMYTANPGNTLANNPAMVAEANPFNPSMFSATRPVPNPALGGKGDFSRTPEDWAARAYAGKSNPETRHDIVERQMKLKENSIRDKKTELVDLIADAVERGDAIKPEWINRAKELGFRGADLNQSVRQRIMDRRTGSIDRAIGRRPTVRGARLREYADDQLNRNQRNAPEDNRDIDIYDKRSRDFFTPWE